MFEQKYTTGWESQARTLNTDVLGNNKSGWIIIGNIVEDHYEWIENFKAVHPLYGFVEGNFETGVKASSQDTLKQFLKDHPFEEWDYQDI